MLFSRFRIRQRLKARERIYNCIGYRIIYAQRRVKMNVQQFYKLVRETCDLITQKDAGKEMFRRPEKAKLSEKNSIEDDISTAFFRHLNEKLPRVNCLSWLGASLQTSDTVFFWYPVRKTDAIIPGGEQQALLLEFKVFDKKNYGQKGCDISNAFVQLLQCMMMDSRKDKEGAVVVFDIWDDSSTDRHFSARPHDKVFVWQIQQMSCARNIHLIWIWFDKQANTVMCDLCPREEAGHC